MTACTERTLGTTAWRLETRAARSSSSGVTKPAVPYRIARLRDLAVFSVTTLHEKGGVGTPEAIGLLHPHCPPPSVVIHSHQHSRTHSSCRRRWSMAVTTPAQSFSMMLSVFCTVALIVRSMVRHSSSISLSHVGASDYAPKGAGVPKVTNPSKLQRDGR